MDAIFEPQTGAHELAEHPHRIHLLGEPTEARQPEICAYCGAAARQYVPVPKVFREPSGDVTAFRVQTVAVRFCDPCIADHERERVELTPTQRWVVGLGTGLTVSAIGSAFMAIVFLPDAWRSLGQRGFPLPVVVVLLFAAIAAGSLRGAWTNTAHRRVPPQTRITRAFDFSASGAPLFGKKGYTCSIRDATFAEAFGELNRDRVRRA